MSFKRTGILQANKLCLGRKRKRRKRVNSFSESTACESTETGQKDATSAAVSVLNVDKGKIYMFR